MARSLSLNPASTPFFPGGSAFGDDDLTGSIPHTRSPPRDSGIHNTSQPTSGPPEYRTFHSSPSPTSDQLDRSSPRTDLRSNSRLAPDSADPRTSPTIRQVRADRAYPGVEIHARRELSMAGTIETLPEEGQTMAPAPMNLMNGALRPRTGSTSRREPFLGGLLNRSRENVGYQAGGVLGGSRTSSFNTAPGTVLSSSPVSSVESISQAASSADQTLSFEAQLHASPMIHDILDRLIRCEHSTHQIQRELGDVNRKIDLLLERALAPNSGAPQFNDPFAPSNTASGLGPRASFSANIAPNQPDPANDIGAINQRLSTLTSSVGQLLALQTQNMQITSNAVSASSNVLPSRKVPGADGPPSGPFSNGQTPIFVTRGISQPRGGSATRGGNAPLPVRNWSVGNLESPLRTLDSGSASALRGGKSIVEDRRSSVMGLMRRDSIPAMDNWSTGAPASSVATPSPLSMPRADGTGPTLTKWDQLPLASELLHSLAKFGVGPPNKIQQRALPFLLRGADIIAQAPPTQERIAAYVIPAIQTVLAQINSRPVVRGPIVVMVSTTVDQATQAQRMIRDLGGPIGVRSALGVGVASGDIGPEVRLLQQNVPHIICGTPQKLHAIFTSPGGLSGAEVRFLVLDEVDQLIARNLHEFVYNIVKLFPSPRARPLNPPTSASSSTFDSNGASAASAAFNPTPGRKFSSAGLPAADGTTETPAERQTALFSNTVPQDVLNLANTIQLREPVRVLVRRDGTVTQADTTQGARGLRQFYLYLALTAGGRPDPSSGGNSGLGIIGSGRGATSAETSQAREWKLDALADLFEDVEIPHAIVHVGGMAALEAVVYKLQTRNVDAVALHGDMAPAARMTAINRFRSTTPLAIRTKALVIYDVQVKSTEVSQIPLVINYDLPKAVEEYAHRVAPAIASNYNRAGVVVNFVTATGGDVEMLRSIECFYKIKCPEVPMSIRDIL